MSTSTDCGFEAIDISIEPHDSRESFFNIINFFMPAIHVAVVNCHRQRDTWLTAEAQNAIAAHSGTGVNVIRRRVKMLLTLETILCTEYGYVCPLMAVVISRFTDCQRNSYFAVINPIGTPAFQFV